MATKPTIRPLGTEWWELCFVASMITYTCQVFWLKYRMTEHGKEVIDRRDCTLPPRWENILWYGGVVVESVTGQIKSPPAGWWRDYWQLFRN